MYMYDFAIKYEPDEILKYLRKSRSDDPTLSVEEVLERHETILDEWAEKHLSGKIPGENCYREIVSGETIDDRPEIQKVLKRIESPKIKAILTVEVQRLSRGDLEDAGRLIKLLRYTNTAVITPTKTYDLSNEYDRDIFERELKRGNEFLEYQKKIMNRGRLLSVSQGNYIGSIPPYGYEKIWVSDGKKKSPTLREKKEEADVVRMIFDWYAVKDMGTTIICNNLDKMGIKPPKGKYWSVAALKDLLSNVHYIGKVKWNWRKTVKIVDGGEVKNTRPKSKDGDYLVYDGKHDAIVSEEIFYAAQEKRSKNHRAKQNHTLINPFASILFCQCGRVMLMKQYKSKDSTDIRRRLVCNDQKHCHSGSCTYEEIVTNLQDFLTNTIEDFKLQLKQNNLEEISHHEKIIRGLEKKLKDIEARELSQWEAQSDPDPEKRMPQHVFQKLNEKLQEEKRETIEAITFARASTPAPTYYEQKIKTFQNVLKMLEDTSISVAEKNRLLKSCIERIEYRREKPTLLKREPDEKKGTRLSVGGNWSSPPIHLDVKLKT